MQANPEPGNDKMGDIPPTGRRNALNGGGSPNLTSLTSKKHKRPIGGVDEETLSLTCE